MFSELEKKDGQSQPRSSRIGPLKGGGVRNGLERPAGVQLKLPAGSNRWGLQRRWWYWDSAAAKNLTTKSNWDILIII